MTNTQKSSKSALYLIIAVVVAVSIGYRLISDYGLEQTSLLFIGLPTLIAVLMVRYSEKPATPYGAAFKAITLFLLIASIALGEGLICIIMAAPLFYGVTALLVAAYNYLNKDKEESDILQMSLLLPLAILLAQPTDFNKEPILESVVVSKEVSSTHLNQLNKQPDFQLDLPMFFQMGFPKPIAIEGKGLEKGDTRTIQFESTTKGIGALVLEINEVDDTSITFNVVSDDTHIAHWLSWKKIEITIAPLTNTTSKISWTSYYTCDLGPTWYFSPLERFAVSLSNEHLIAAFFE